MSARKRVSKRERDARLEGLARHVAGRLNVTDGEHEKAARQKLLAELGAKCLEILGHWSVALDGQRRDASEMATGAESCATSAAEYRIVLAARSLGLLTDDDRRTLPERLKDLGAAAERLAATSRPDDDEGGKA